MVIVTCCCKPRQITWQGARLLEPNIGPLFARLFELFFSAPMGLNCFIQVLFWVVAAKPHILGRLCSTKGSYTYFTCILPRGRGFFLYEWGVFSRRVVAGPSLHSFRPPDFWGSCLSSGSTQGLHFLNTHDWYGALRLKLETHYPSGVEGNQAFFFKLDDHQCPTVGVSVRKNCVWRCFFGKVFGALTPQRVSIFITFWLFTQKIPGDFDELSKWSKTASLAIFWSFWG